MCHVVTLWVVYRYLSFKLSPELMKSPPNCFVRIDHVDNILGLPVGLLFSGQSSLEEYRSLNFMFIFE